MLSQSNLFYSYITISFLYFEFCRAKQKSITKLLILNSSFPISHSPFPIPHSPFLIPHSSYLISHSSFLIPHSPFLIPHSISLSNVQATYAVVNSHFYTCDLQSLQSFIFFSWGLEMRIRKDEVGASVFCATMQKKIGTLQLAKFANLQSFHVTDLLLMRYTLLMLVTLIGDISFNLLTISILNNFANFASHYCLQSSLL